MNTCNRLCLSTCLAFLSYSQTSVAQLTNPSFEQGLAGWTYDAVAYPIGTPSAPIGVDGSTVANLGTFDQPGSYIFQTFPLAPGDYVLSFSMGANATAVGLVAAADVTIVGNDGSTVGVGSFSVAAVGPVAGAAGFEFKTLVFTVPASVSSVTLQFADTSPNGGVSVDVMIDNVQLTPGTVPPPPPPPPPPAAFANGGFELGLASWTHDATAYAIGDAGFPIGVDGVTVADLGVFDVPGSFISQTFALSPGEYTLSFAMGANGGAGLLAAVDVSILGNDGSAIGAANFSVLAPGVVSGGFGFESKVYGFTVPTSVSSVTLTFTDASPGGGAGVDPMLDAITITQGPPPPPPPPPPFTNGSFESGLSGWMRDGNTYPIGDASFPVGVDGSTAANLGTFDQPGSFLAQTFAIDAGVHTLLFALGANGVAPGLPTAVEVSLVTDEGTLLAKAIYSVDSLGYLDHGAGFSQLGLGFVVPATAKSVTLRFTDLSPGGGYGVDLLIDAVRIASGRPVPRPLSNPSFELGLAGWYHDIATYPIGDASFPVGTGGHTAANLGTFDQPGSFLQQTLSVRPGRYVLSFQLGANGTRQGLVAAVEARILSSDGTLLARSVSRAKSLGRLKRGLGFDGRELSFRVPASVSDITIQFNDVSPGGGVSVDAMVDDVRLESEGE